MSSTPAPHAIEEVARLTPRQREVLALIAEGLTNPQIAERLAISRDGVKWHVSEILSRTGLDTREEAADLWRRYNGLPYRLHRLLRALLAPAAWHWIAGSAGAAAVAALVVVVVIVAARPSAPASDTLPPPSATSVPPTPVASPQPEPSVTVSPNDGLLPGARTVTVTDDVAFPPDTSLLIVDGPWGKDGGPFDLRRVYRLGAGPVEQTVLYKPAVPSDGAISDTWITNVLADQDGGKLYLAICTGTECPYLGEVSDVATTFLYSTDGGVTWTNVGEQDGRWGLTAFYEDSAIAARPFGSKLQYINVRTGAAVEVASDLAGLASAVGAGQPAWWARGAAALLDISGSQLVQPAGFNTSDFTGVDVLLGGPGGAGVLTASETYAAAQAAGTTQHGYLFSYAHGLDGAPATFAFQQGVPSPAAWLDSETLLVTAPYERAGTCTAQGVVIGADPAILDMKTGVMSYIKDPFYDPACSHGSQRVLAVQTGPLVQVHTDGDCLNLRTAANLAAASERCLPDGVLLTRTGAAEAADGDSWIAVRAPGGAQGYVAARFVTVGS